MRIGILTYHKSHNFGAMLQAYALKTYLESMGGADVTIIDYYPTYFHDNQLIDTATIKNLSWKGRVKYIITSLVNLSKIRKRKQAYYSFIDKYLVPLSPVSSQYDLVIYGSDQIWRYQSRDSFRGFSDVYWGKSLINATHKISYAASMGTIPNDSETASYCTSALSNFDALSVRELDLKEYLIKLCPSRKIFQHLDPIFLLDRRQWTMIGGRKRINGKYILVYNLQNVEFVEKIASKLHNKTGYPIVNIRASFTKLFLGSEDVYDAGPDDFISLIKDAEYVVTSSFHGTAFSILLNVPFYCCLDSAPNRVLTLLTSVGLSERMVSSIKNITMKSIDWDDVNYKIADMVLDSKDYLHDQIKLIRSL